MLLDHHIRYKKQVYLGDIITVRTYPLTPEGAKQPRKVEFYCNEELVVDSKSTLWILFDPETKNKTSGKRLAGEVFLAYITLNQKLNTHEILLFTGFTLVKHNRLWSGKSLLVYG